MFDIEKNLKKLPDSPGVYIHRDKLGRVIYVGKAVSLRKRVRQYFRPRGDMDAKSKAMSRQIAEFEYITVDSEMEAFILECTLIKKYRPKYNILLKDDKTYPYIKVTTSEEWPRILKTRIVKDDGDRYFGPYSDVGAVNMMVELLGGIYRLKKCRRINFPSGYRPCLNYHIGSCDGICIGKGNHESYIKAVDAAIDFLSGKSKNLEAYLEEHMREAAEKMDYESAARYRDYLAAARSLLSKQRVVLKNGSDMDIVLSAGGGNILTFFVREGKMVGRETYKLKAGDEDRDREIVQEFLRQHYAEMTEGPPEILIESALPETEMTADYLARQWGHKVFLHVPVKGEKKQILDVALKNSREMRENIEERERNKEERKRRIGEAFFGMLKNAGYADGEYRGQEYRIEAYDISNTNGVDTVGGMVVFVGMKKEKKDYRRFKVRTSDGPDDYGSMQEVLYRRFRRMQEGDSGFLTMPDALLIDGGRGHVSAATEVISALGIKVPVFGMAKDDSHRTRSIVYMKDGVFREESLADHKLLFGYIGTIQEEVHRFAIEYHRGLRDKSRLTSALDEIEGIGPAKRNALLSHFGSVENVKKASREELSEARGITEKLAASVYEYFH